MLELASELNGTKDHNLLQSLQHNSSARKFETNFISKLRCDSTGWGIVMRVITRRTKHKGTESSTSNHTFEKVSSRDSLRDETHAKKAEEVLDKTRVGRLKSKVSSPNWTGLSRYLRSIMYIKLMDVLIGNKWPEEPLSTEIIPEITNCGREDWRGAVTKAKKWLIVKHY